MSVLITAADARKKSPPRDPWIEEDFHSVQLNTRSPLSPERNRPARGNGSKIGNAEKAYGHRAARVQGIIQVMPDTAGVGNGS